jgi:methionyl-tRNA formyltransferase
MSRLRVVFMGTPEFSIPPLKVLIEHTDVVAVYTQPDRPVGRGLKLQASPVKTLALEHGIPVFTPERISTPEEVRRLRDFAPDFCVVVAYGQILKPEVIAIPKIDTVNIHSSLLPRWRGAAPIQWAILAGDPETGVTTMRIVPKLDAGDILLQESTPISNTDTAETVHDRLSEIGARLILPTLEGLRDRTLSPRVQDESKVMVAKKLVKEMERLDWSKTLREVDLAVRALQPWPGTRIETQSGLRLKIKKGIPAKGGAPFRMGELSEFQGRLLLGCADGAYELIEIQEEGKKTVQAIEFLNGIRGRGISLPAGLKGERA